MCNFIHKNIQLDFSKTIEKTVLTQIENIRFLYRIIEIKVPIIST